MRSDKQRRREIKNYYLGISADEITSYLTPAPLLIGAHPFVAGAVSPARPEGGPR
jgi:hypothetical protein